MLNYANTLDLESSLAGSTLGVIDLLDDVARDVTAWADILMAVSEQGGPIDGRQLEPISACLAYAGKALKQASGALHAPTTE